MLIDVPEGPLHVVAVQRTRPTPDGRHDAEALRDIAALLARQASSSLPTRPHRNSQRDWDRYARHYLVRDLEAIADRIERGAS
jgi:hypothetical protein